MKRALILGINGQDGSYLADLLLAKGYEVHGLYRRSSVDNLWRIRHLDGKVTLHQGDLSDGASVENVIAKVMPDEIYNEADQDSVGWSHVSPDYQYDVTFRAVGRLLEFVKQTKTRIFQPCTAMMFGDAAKSPQPAPQDEGTPFNPQSPYAVAKVAAYYACRHYREQHGVYVSCGILYNHDSPRRSEHYLLHKTCNAAVRIASGKQETLSLGNLDGRVDVGFAGDYMEAAWLALQQPKPDDYVVATGQAWSVEEMVAEAFEQAGVRPVWTCADGSPRITKDAAFWKPGAPSILRGDASKANKVLGWKAKHCIKDLIAMLIADAKAKEQA